MAAKKKAKKSVTVARPVPMRGHHEVGPTGKKLLHREEEFSILKLVLDKFLWLGLFVVAYGLFKFYEGIGDDMIRGVTILITGIVILGLFVILLWKEYEIVDHI